MKAKLRWYMIILFILSFGFSGLLLLSINKWNIIIAFLLLMYMLGSVLMMSVIDIVNQYGYSKRDVKHLRNTLYGERLKK